MIKIFKKLGFSSKGTHNIVNECRHGMDLGEGSMKNVEEGMSHVVVMNKYWLWHKIQEGAVDILLVRILAKFISTRILKKGCYWFGYCKRKKLIYYRI